VLARHEAVAAPFPDAWRAILSARVLFYAGLTDGERARFEAQVKLFVYTKAFSARGLPAVTDEMKVVIAATACRLTMNMPGEEYGRLRHIAVMDGPFRDRDGDDEDVIGRAGYDKVTVSWPHVLSGLADPADGANVGYHEFAHVLDAADGEMDGFAPSHHFSHYQVWPRLVSEGHAAVRRAVEEASELPIDAYAGKDESEFFAVATEWFFEMPAALRKKMPALYDVLSQFYGQDPLSRETKGAGDSER
jgi:Mlc titration factor MtfA (ptsG expression regulator)